jgi:phosphoribosylanthranilate isomerase
MLIKICGLTKKTDAELALTLGADLLGIVMSESSKRRATPEQANDILNLQVAKPVYLVFGYDSADYIRHTYTALANQSTRLQIMADHPQIESLLQLAPADRIMPSISAATKITDADIERLKNHTLVLFDSHAKPPPLRPGERGPGGEVLAGLDHQDAILGGDQALPPRVAGGTGQTFDHGNIAGITRPYLLAGGLTPGNVGRIVAEVNPPGVDVASGTEGSPGAKDPEKLKAFIQNVRRAQQARQVSQ